MKIRTKLLVLIFLSGIGCLLLFRFLWLQKWDIWGLLVYDFPVELSFLPRLDEDFYEKMAEEALKYNIPESEDDTEAIEAIAPFFDLADDYTAIYLYGLEDGLYRTGVMPEIMNISPFRTFFDIGYDWTNGSGEQYATFPLQFKNGYGSIHTAAYHGSCFIFPYFVFCLIVSIALFLSVILFFVSKKMKTVVMLKETILRMSSGDLKTPVQCREKDELGILSKELDQLRITLHENFSQEQELHRSNRELIAALSHDLRTPLTILKGYLEILRLNRQKEMQTEYINRCLQKADDIQEMTDRMFEYALVYDAAAGSSENVMLTEIPLASIADSLQEHADFLQLAGFQTSLHFPAVPLNDSMKILADAVMLKRILNNLFSNVIKYADKKECIMISADTGSYLTIAIKNGIKSGHNDTESTQIGLKSVQKMMEFMDGALILHSEDGSFMTELRFPAV